MFKAMSVLAALLIGQFAYSASTAPFKNRFNLVRADGKVKYVRDRSLAIKFSIAPYVSWVKEQLIREQNMMLSESDYEGQVRELLEGSKEGFLTAEDQEQNEMVLRSLSELKKIDVEKIFTDSGFNKVIGQFEKKMSDALLMLDPTLIANLDNPRFFYRQRVTYQVLKWALDMAKKTLSHIPILNTASFVLVKVEKMIRERREFHQNMALHYLENFSSEELGLTHDEANRFFSSIYESRISWFAFWESQQAADNWGKFGTGKFFAGIRAVNNRLRQNRDHYQSLNKRLNYAFQGAVTKKGEEVILNLYDGTDLLRSRPAVAHYMASPQKVKRLRIVLQLAQLGLSFVPIADFIKSIAGTYMKSLYEKQQLTEGALYGYFESNNLVDGMRRVSRQYINPFDSVALQN